MYLKLSLPKYVVKINTSHWHKINAFIHVMYKYILVHLFFTRGLGVHRFFFNYSQNLLSDRFSIQKLVLLKHLFQQLKKMNEQ